MEQIRRIGRTPTAAERCLMNAIERPKLLDVLAASLAWNVAGENFHQVTVAEQDAWRNRALAIQRQHVDSAPPGPPPDDPEPGATEPAPAVA